MSYSTAPVNVNGGSSVKIGCPDGQPIIGITDPFWGDPTDATTNSTTIYSYLATKCLGQQSCTVSADTLILGDPAPDASKTLKFGYT